MRLDPSPALRVMVGSNSLPAWDVFNRFGTDLPDY